MSTTELLPESNVCPTCTREFASERGMRVHHTTVHDEQLPNQHCSDCGTAFYASNGDRMRCDDCTPRRRKRDLAHGNTTGTCLICDSEFRYYTSEKEGHYCPHCVTDDDVTCNLHLTAEKKVPVSCSHCNNTKSLFPSEVDERTNHFCDRTCYREWLSSTQRANQKWCKSDNPNWSGGVDADDLYRKGWPRARRRTLQRDGHSCQRCGASRDELGQNPDVHHIQPVRIFDEPHDAHTLDNLVCLCRACHLTVERSDTPLLHQGDEQNTDD